MALRILVVDDDQIARSIYVFALTSQGHFVMCAEDGQEALEKLGAEEFDVLITDLVMPRVDGIELARAVRRDARLVDMPVVLITSRDDRETRLRALEVADAIMTKPVDLMELYLCLDTLMRGRRRVLALREYIALVEHTGVLSKLPALEVEDGLMCSKKGAVP